jgi:hypothetical protein
MSTLIHENISATYANPPTIIKRGKQNAGVCSISGTLELATTDLDDTDITHLAIVPWDAKIQKIIIFNDALDTHGTPTLTHNVGLYTMTRDGTFAVVDVDAYASAITTLRSANTLGVNVAFEARDINKLGVNTVLLDSVATLSAVPANKSAVISLTQNAAAATAAAGTVSFIIEYVQ